MTMALSRLPPRAKPLARIALDVLHEAEGTRTATSFAYEVSAKSTVVDCADFSAQDGRKRWRS